jgi:hypothetical protein
VGAPGALAWVWHGNQSRSEPLDAAVCVECVCAAKPLGDPLHTTQVAGGSRRGTSELIGARRSTGEGAARK